MIFIFGIIITTKFIVKLSNMILSIINGREYGG